MRERPINDCDVIYLKESDRDVYFEEMEDMMCNELRTL
jgi:hypothetical protein